MRVDGLEVHGFGHFSELELQLQPGLNVIHGENEAGKSTLLAFIRAGLFGFGRQEPRFEPSQGVHGGTLWLQTAGGKVMGVRRTWKRASKLEGDLQLLGAHKEPLPPSLLQETLSGVGRDLFCQLFAFGLDELADFNKLAKETSVAEALFAAGMRGARRLPEVTSEWKKRSEGIFGMTASAKRPLNEALAHLRDVRDRLDALGDRPARYFDLCTRRDELAAEERALAQALAAGRKEAGALLGLLQAAEALRQVSAHQAVLRELPASLGTFPADGVLRLEALQGRRRRAQVAERELQAALEALGAEQTSLESEALAPQLRADLALASARYAEQAGTARGLPARRAALAARERAAEEAVRGLGLSQGAAELMTVDAGASAQAQLSQLGADRAAAHRALREAEAGRAHHGSRLEEVQATLEENARALDAVSFASRESLAQKRAQAQRRARLSDELAGARALAARAQAERDAHRARRQVIPAAAVYAVAAAGLALSGAAFALAGPWASGAVAATGALVTFLLLWLRARLEAERRAEGARLEQAWTDAQAKVAGLSREADALGPAPEGLEQELSALERAVNRRESLTEERAGLERRRDALAREGSGLAEAVAAAAGKWDAAHAAFCSFVRARGLPEGVEPEAALKLLVGVAQAQGRLSDCRAEAEALCADEAGVRAALQTLVQAALRAGLPAPDAADLPGRVQALLLRQEKVSTERSLLQRQVKDQQTRLCAAVTEREETDAALCALYAAAGVADGDEETFRHRAAQAARRALAEGELLALTREVEAAARMPLSEAQAALEAAGGETKARARHEALEQQVAQAEAALGAVLTSRGEVNKELEGLQTDEEAARLRAEEQRLLVQIRALATRYTRDRLGLHLLARARQRFEQEQQPRVVQLASRHFSELTGYRYGRVFMPAEEGAGELRVVDAEGQTKKAQMLSRGTKEQLYLAFRLAVVEEFSESRAPLPLVLDDILVNFDPRRAKNAAKVLARLSARHQVLAFTCHTWMRELLGEVGANPVELHPRALQLAALPR